MISRGQSIPDLAAWTLCNTKAVVMRIVVCWGTTSGQATTDCNASTSKTAKIDVA